MAEGVLLSLLENCLGGYFRTVVKSVFVKSERQVGGSAGAPTAHIMPLKPPTRIASVDECDATDRLSADAIKLYTGGSSISGRALFKDYEVFKTISTPLISTNDFPRYDATDPALQMRAHFVPFPVTFRPVEELEEGNSKVKKINMNLKTELAEDAAREEALVWLVNGAVSWHTKKISPEEIPTCALQAKSTLNADNDPFAMFLDARCELGADLVVKSAQLHFACNDWMVSQGHHKITPQQLTKNLAAKKITKVRKYQLGGEQTDVFKGLKLASM